MKNIERLHLALDTEPLRKAVEREDALFGQITARQTTPGSPHSDTETIFLRWAPTQTVHAVFNEIPAVDYPAYGNLPEALPLMNKVLHLVGASELGRVIIVRFKPKGFISPHIDEGAYADHFERFHVVLDSDPGNHFLVENTPGEGEFVHMKPGDLYWFNHKKTHAVINWSERPRLHMIIDAVAPKFRRERE